MTGLTTCLREHERGTPPPVSTDPRRVCERRLTNPRASAVRYAVQAAMVLGMGGATGPGPRRVTGYDSHSVGDERNKPPLPEPSAVFFFAKI